MDISEFDFTKFSKEKWQEILSQFVDGWIVDKIEVNYKTDGEIIPVVTLDCWEKMERGLRLCELSFDAFNVNKNNKNIDYFTKNWRKFMLKEFGDEYYNALFRYLEYVKEQKIQQADEEFEEELRYLHNIV